MNVQEFYNYIKHPDLLNETTLNELSEVIGRYPYFQAARMLYLKNLFLLNDDRYQAVLIKTSIYAPDRKVLFYLINQKDDIHTALHNNFEKENEEKEIKTFETEKSTLFKTEDLIDTNILKPSTDIETKKLPEKEVEEVKQKPINIADHVLNKINEIKKQSAKIRQTEKEEIFDINKQKNAEPLFFTFDEWLNYISSHKEQEKTMPENSLIDKFLDNASSLTRIRVEQETDNEDLTKHLIPAEELEIISEPLAQLYYKQGHYDKALKLYEKLFLNNPEKSIYFASLIQEIKNKLDKS